MDPITAIGAVASIIQLAQTAFSLSKTLYSLGSAISSATEDLHSLADDLGTFSTTLTILSRQLEDSKSRYSDEVYLLTSKIIKDCAKLYDKIEKLLVKLGSKGKTGWKLRVKFVYKEAQILKMKKRLVELKGTLAIILFTLQLDFQLTWLDISSSSKMQRAPEKQLQIETVNTLNDAQRALEIKQFSSISREINEKGSQDTTTPSQQLVGAQPGIFNQSGISGATVREFQGAPLSAQQAATGGWSHVLSNFVIQPQSATQMPTKIKDRSPSPRSVSSTESFQSAEETSIVIVHDIKAVQGVLHTFKFALEVLEKLIQKQIAREQGDILLSAKYLTTSLKRGEKTIRDTHKHHYRSHGQRYIATFTEMHTSALQNVSAILMKEVVMVLHSSTALYSPLSTSSFESMYSWSETCRAQAVFEIDKVVSQLVGLPGFQSAPIHPVEGEEPESDDDSYLAYAPSKSASWGWTLNLARAIGLAKPKHRPLVKKSSVVVPRLFGPSNSLHGIVTEPIGFDEVSSWSSSSDFGQFERTETVYPVPTSHPALFEAAHSLSISSGRPGPVPLQQPQVIQPVSQSVYGPSSTSLKSLALNRAAGAAASASLVSRREESSRVGSRTTNIQLDSDDEWDEPRRSKKKSRRDSERYERRIEAPVDAFSDLRREDSDWHDEESRERKRPSSISKERIHPSIHAPEQAQPNDLWWEAYSSLQYSRQEDFEAIRCEFEKYIGVLSRGDSSTSTRLSQLFARLPTSSSSLADHPHLRAAAEQKGKITKIVAMIDQQLGLQIATIAWSCVYIVLAIYETSLSKLPQHPQDKDLNILNQTTTQLLEIVSIISRYAIMENLYRKSPCLTVEPNYQTAILDLCVTILGYFARAFELAKDGNEGRLRQCQVWVDDAVKRDGECRNFGVRLDVEEGSEDESESE